MPPKKSYSAPLPTLFFDQIFNPNAPRVPVSRTGKASVGPTARPEQRPFTARFSDSNKQPPDPTN